MDWNTERREFRPQERNLSKKVDFGFAYSTAASALSIIAILLALSR